MKEIIFLFYSFMENFSIFIVLNINKSYIFETQVNYSFKNNENDITD